MAVLTRKQPGLRDVAKRLSLSVCTVSKAINGQPGVKAHTRQRVMKAAGQLGYVPDRQAQIMRGVRSRRIELHLPTLANPVYSETMRDVYQAAADHGYEVMVSSYECNMDMSRQLGMAAIGHRSEAVLLPGGWEQASVEAMVDAGIVVLLVNPGPAPVPQGAAVLDTDVADGVRQLVHHLLALGHRRPLLLDEWMNDPRYKRGLLTALREAGLPEDDFVMLPCVDQIEFMRGNYERIMEAFKDGRRPATAFMASNDQGAIGAIAALHASGLSVPGDVSVTGVDNIAVSQFSHPPLTTASQTHLHLGRQAVEMAISIMKEQYPRNVKRVLRPELVVRQSTGPVNPARAPASASTLFTGGSS